MDFMITKSAYFRARKSRDKTYAHEHSLALLSSDALFDVSLTFFFPRMIKLGLGIDDTEEEEVEAADESDMPPLEGDAEDASRMEEVD